MQTDASTILQLIAILALVGGALCGVIWRMLDKRIMSIEGQAAQDRERTRDRDTKIFQRLDEIKDHLADLAIRAESRRVETVSMFQTKDECARRHDGLRRELTGA